MTHDLPPPADPFQPPPPDDFHNLPTMLGEAPPPPRVRNFVILVPLAVGCAVALTLGVYGAAHQPTGIAFFPAAFSSGIAAKAWFTTGALLLALAQLFTALIMWGKIRWVPPSAPIAVLHRWSGRFAFLLTVPVAIHCLYALGFAHSDARVMLHSLAGCLFFGAFTTKMLILPKKNLPGWVLPVAGGFVFTLLVGLWLTSSLWFFTTGGGF